MSVAKFGEIEYAELKKCVGFSSSKVIEVLGWTFVQN